MTPAEQRRFGLLLLAAFVLLAAGLGLRAPWPPDEPRFALIARDMALSGEWLFPRVGGVLYPDKPPLFFWLVAAAYSVFRSINVAMFVPALVAGVVVTGLTADLGRRLWGASTGLWCGALLLALIQFPLQMKGGQIDAVLCLWTTLGLYGFCRHLLLGPDWRWYAIGGVAAGLGTITKGVGFLPYLVFIPYLFAAWRDWPRPAPGRDWRWLLAPAASLIVIAAWLVPMLLAVEAANDPAYVAYRDNILFHQTVTRYADSWGHIKPPWYLFTNAVPWLWLPATLLLPWLVPAWRRDLGRRETRILLLGGWVLLVLLFFSLSAGKRSVYIFPAAPAVALLAGVHVAAILERPIPARLVRLLPAIFGVLLMVAAGLLYAEPERVAKSLPDTDTALAAARGVGIIGLAMVLAVLLAGRRHRLAGYAAAFAIFWIAVPVALLPMMDAERSGRGLVAAVEADVGPDRELAFVDWPEQFLLQATRPIVHFGFRRDPEAEGREATHWLLASPDRVILLPASSPATRCFDEARLRLAGRAHRRDWMLADAGMLNGHCDPVAGHPILYRPPGATAATAKDSAGSGL